MRNMKRSGFTLVELLVVITIIAILAVGGISVFTSQMAKARDSTRLSDMKSLEGALGQSMSDFGVYPSQQITAATCTESPTTNIGVSCLVTKGFITVLPKDPKAKQRGVGSSSLDYLYSASGANNVEQQRYELSTGFESSGNASKADNGSDGGNDTNRIEFGLGVNEIDTSYSSAITSSGCLTPLGGTPTAAGIQVIRGNCS